MGKYRKKPVVIEAFQWQPRMALPQYVLDNYSSMTSHEGDAGPYILNLKTLEGPLNVSPGDWIIRGIKGEVYPCKPDIFEATYEAVEDEPEKGKS